MNTHIFFSRVSALAMTAACATFALSTPSHVLHAQQVSKGSNSCRLDTTASWFKSQKSFYAGLNEQWSNDSLRTALLNAAGYNTKTAFVPELGWRLGESSSSINTDPRMLNLLRDMAQRRQWPTRATVGLAGVHAAWLIAQRDSVLTVAAMHRMMEAGPGESSPAEVAVLEDARRVQIGRGQIHGTQFRRDGAAVRIAGHLEDSVRVDMRREAAWLPPIAVSACLASKAP